MLVLPRAPGAFNIHVIKVDLNRENYYHQLRPSKRLFTVSVVISNKEGARDPEGETILRDLVHKSGFEEVKAIRAGKFLRVEVEAGDEEAAARLVRKMCDELSIFNPAAHSLTRGSGATHRIEGRRREVPGEQLRP